MNSDQIVRTMNELISAVEVLCLHGTHQVNVHINTDQEFPLRIHNNNLKRSLGQLKAARASFYSTIYNSEIKEVR